MKEGRIILLIVVCILCSQRVLASQPERSRKWHVGAEVAMSMLPSFAYNQHQQQFEVGVSVGRTLSPFFYLGLGANYIFYSSNANCLPVWITPRVYFSRKPSSFLLDLKIGGIVYSPQKDFGDKTISSGVTYYEMGIGYQIKEHLIIGVYGNIYGTEVWLKKSERMEYSTAIAAGLKLGYEF